MTSLGEELNTIQRRMRSEEERGEGKEVINKFIMIQREEGMKARGGLGTEQ